MNLRELINRLETLPPEQVFARGFGAPDSWRGSYNELAFPPEENVSVQEMLSHAKSAVGETFTGYKGGEYRMDLDTPVNLDVYGCYDPEAAEKMVALFSDNELVRLRAALAAKEAEVKALTEKVAGLTAAVKEICDADDRREPLGSYIIRLERVLEDTAPILAAHDAAKQAELVEALRDAAESIESQVGTRGGVPATIQCALIRIRAILAKYPKAAKEGA